MPDILLFSDTEKKSESQQVKAYELRAYENISLKSGFPQAIEEIAAIDKSSFDFEIHVRFDGGKFRIWYYR
jgi:hypothetical protein